LKPKLKAVFFLIAIFLTGCLAPPQISTPLPQRIFPYAGGLKIADSGGQEISFDRKQAGVVTAIQKLVGSDPIKQSNKGRCQIVTWVNGLSIVFINQDFVGWIAAPPVWTVPLQSAGNTCGWVN